MRKGGEEAVLRRERSPAVLVAEEARHSGGRLPDRLGPGRLQLVGEVAAVVGRHKVRNPAQVGGWRDDVDSGRRVQDRCVRVGVSEAGEISVLRASLTRRHGGLRPPRTAASRAAAQIRRSRRSGLSGGSDTGGSGRGGSRSGGSQRARSRRGGPQRGGLRIEST